MAAPHHEDQQVLEQQHRRETPGADAQPRGEACA
jgi:hypothetical protein